MIRLGAIALFALLIPGCHHHKHHSSKHHAIREVRNMPKEGQYFQVQQDENGEKELVLIMPERHKIKGN